MSAAIDPDKLSAFALRVWKYKEGEVLSLMVHLGDRLGLYEAMAGAGPQSAGELAARTGTHERWVLEWARSQAAAGLLESDDGETFWLEPEGAEVLANRKGSVWFAAGAFQGGVAPPDVVDRLAGAFRSGAGLSYDDLGPSAAHAVESMLEPWTRLALVPRILPALDGVVERLEAGGRVADVGCGAGVALLTVAAAFRKAHCEGWDPSRHAIAAARRNAEKAKLPNAVFHLAPAADLPRGPTFDLVMALDCVHDMPRPGEALAAMRRTLRDDGTLLIKDIKSTGTWEGDQRNPLLALMYGTSVAVCMSAALSEPGGAGLGTLGFHPERARRMCEEAGFTRFTIHDLDDPANLYYEVRP